jgi:hypothetical protein
LRACSRHLGCAGTFLAQAAIVYGVPRIDLGYLRGMLAELEAALGQSDLMPLFEQLFAEKASAPKKRRKRK